MNYRVAGRGVAETAGPGCPPWGGDASARQESPYVPRKSSRNGALIFSLSVFAAAFLLVVGFTALAGIRVGLSVLALATLAAGMAASCVHIALGWERVVDLRFGDFNRVAGPGLYFTIPIVEHGTIRIDERVVATPFFAERTLTADLVPVNMDAVLYWMVRDAEKACTEVEDYYSAVAYLAQTALREAVGRSTVAEVAVRRNELDAEIQADIEREAASWGVDVIAVKVRDIVLPVELQETMSLEAQADRELNARMAVAGAEADVAEMLAEAARSYGDPEAALKLRAMLMQYETVRRSGGAVVTVPSAVSDGFADGLGRAATHGGER